MASRNRPHIIVARQPETDPYTSHGTGRPSARPAPPIDRLAHGRALARAAAVAHDAGIERGRRTPSGQVPMVAPSDVITVGNADASTLNKSTTSSYGTFIDIWAIGSGTGTVEATSSSNSASVSNYDGTSEAGPQVAGAIACILQAHPSFTPAQCWQALADNALTAGSVGSGSTTRLLNTQSIPDGGIGTSICPTWSQTTNGNDAWAGITLALRASTGVALAVANLSAGATLTTAGALTQHQALTVDGLGAAATIGAVTLVPSGSLAVDDLSAGATLAAAGALTQHQALAVEGVPPFAGAGPTTGTVPTATLVLAALVPSTTEGAATGTVPTATCTLATVVPTATLGAVVGVVPTAALIVTAVPPTVANPDATTGTVPTGTLTLLALPAAPSLGTVTAAVPVAALWAQAVILLATGRATRATIVWDMPATAIEWDQPHTSIGWEPT